MHDEKIARLKQLHAELANSKLPAALQVDKFREAVLLTIELSLSLIEERG